MSNMGKDQYKGYLQLVKDPNYVELYKYYSRETLMGILGCARSETAHSSFLRWLLDINGSHGLGSAPMRKFLETVCWFYDTVYCDNPNPGDVTKRGKELRNGKTVFSENNTDFLEDIRFGKYNIINQYIANEFVLKNQRRADIFLILEIKMDRNINNNPVYLIMLIENKVHSTEHSVSSSNNTKIGQTQAYANDLEKPSTVKDIIERLKAKNIKWIDETKVFKNSKKLFVYLNSYRKDDIKEAINEKDSDCFAKSSEFITINYQYLLDGVIEPLFDMLEDGLTKERMEDYIRCLGLAKISNINESGIPDENDNSISANDYLIMAVSASEKKKALSLLKKHHEIILKIIESLEYKNNKQSKLLINEADRPFWTSLANLYMLIGTEKIYETIHGELPNIKYNDDYVTLLLANHNPDGRKHLFVFKDKAYMAYDKKKNLGQLVRDIFEDYIRNNIEDNMEPGKTVDIIIKNFRDEIRSKDNWFPNWKDEWLVLENEIKTYDGPVIEIPNCSKIYVGKYWTYDEICRLLDYFFNKKSDMKDKVKKIY